MQIHMKNLIVLNQDKHASKQLKYSVILIRYYLYSYFSSCYVVGVFGSLSLYLKFYKNIFDPCCTRWQNLLADS